MADLPEVPVKIRKEATDLRTPVVRRGEELRPPSGEEVVAGPAVLDANRERMGGFVLIRWSENDIRLVRCRLATLDQKKPHSVEGENCGRPVLPIRFGAQNISIPAVRSSNV